MGNRVTPEQKETLLELDYVEYENGNSGKWTCKKCGSSYKGHPNRMMIHLLWIEVEGKPKDIKFCSGMQKLEDREVLATMLGHSIGQLEQLGSPMNETHGPVALVEDDSGGVEETNAGGSETSKTMHREHSSQPDSTLPSFPQQRNDLANPLDDQNPPSPQDASVSDLMNDPNFPPFENVPFLDLPDYPFEDFSNLMNDEDICSLEDGALEDPPRSVNSMDTEVGLQKKPREENHSLNDLRDLENTSSRAENWENHPNVSDLGIADREEGASPDMRIILQNTINQEKENKKTECASGCGTSGSNPTEARMSRVITWYSYRSRLITWRSYRTRSFVNEIGSRMAFSYLAGDGFPLPHSLSLDHPEMFPQRIMSLPAVKIFKRLMPLFGRKHQKEILACVKQAYSKATALDYDRSSLDQCVEAFDRSCTGCVLRLFIQVPLVKEMVRKIRTTIEEGVQMLGEKRKEQMKLWLAWAVWFKFNVNDLDLNFEKANLPEEILLLLEAKRPEEILSLWKRIKELSKVGDILIDTGTHLLNQIVPRDLLSLNPNSLSCRPQLQNQINPGFPQQQQGEEIDSLNNLGGIGYTSSRAENRENHPNVSDLCTVGREEGASPGMRVGMQNTVSFKERNKKRKFTSGSGTSGSVPAEEEVPPVGALNSSSALRPENASGGEMAPPFVDIKNLLTRFHRVKEMVEKIRSAREGGVDMLGTKWYNEMEYWLAHAAIFEISVKDLDLNFEKAKSPEEILPLLEAKTPEQILLLLKHFKELIEVADKLIETGTKLSNPMVPKDLLSWNLNSRSCGSQWQDQMNSAQIPQQV